MGDAWEDEGYAGEDDWGEESVEADLEEEHVEVVEDEVGPYEEDELEALGRGATVSRGAQGRPLVGPIRGA